MASMVNDLERILKQDGGRKGGSSTSPAKRAAARRNGLESRKAGKKGGRPVGSKKRTLGEFIMREALAANEYEVIAEGWIRLARDGGSHSERFIFKNLFGWEPNKSNHRIFDTVEYRQPRRKLSSGQQLVLKQFRTVARHFLKKHRAGVRPPD